MTVRTEALDDTTSVRRVHEAAFGGSDEADLVDALRSTDDALLSLVVERDGAVVGHVFFSRMWIDTPTGHVAAVALAPLGVSPGAQRQGAGSALVAAGLSRLRAMGERIVIVLGHADYYPRFGFSAARALRLESPFPRGAYMALELTPGALDGVAGRVRYAGPFGI